MNLPETIKNARLHRGLTQMQLARLMNVGQSRVSEWENGTHTPTPETIQRMEEMLNVSFVVSFVEL